MLTEEDFWINLGVFVLHIFNLGIVFDNFYQQMFIFRKRKDFFEMMLHHFFELLLIISSILFGYIVPSSILILIHDITDIPLFCVKIILELNCNLLHILGLIVVCTTFFYYRIYVFMYYIILGVANANINIIHKIFLCVMMTGLYFLHIYWFFMINKLLFNIVQGKNPKDK